MFVRKQVVRKQGRDYTYLKVVESTRKNGKVVQQTLLNVGNVDNWEPGRLQRAICELGRFLGLEPMDLADVRVSQSRQLGPSLALGALWEQVGMDAIVDRALASSTSKTLVPVAAYARAMVLNRLMDPCSKRAVHEWLAEQVQVPGLDPTALPLHGYYRALAHLSQNKPAIERALHLRLDHLFNRDLTLVFYDLTSSYFEGSQCPLARYGYSRDHRADCLQIEIGLLVDAEGVPIAHEVFEGNRTDVSTVLDALKRLKTDFDIRRCVFVGDDGMASEDNLQQVRREGYEYITSVALRKTLVGRQLVSQLPNRRTFRPLKDNLSFLPLRPQPDDAKTADAKTADAEEAGGTPAGDAGDAGDAGERVRYIACYNPERAAANRRHRRERLRACVQKLRRLQTPLTRRSGRRMSPQEKERSALQFVRKHKCAALFQVGLDAQEKPEKPEKLWWRLDKAELRLERARDGLLVLQTNSRTLSDEAVVVGYRTLWRVENAFRHIKDPIRLRPIRHWTDASVRGHVFVCVLAYMLERLLELRLQQAAVPMSAEEALQALQTLHVSTLSLAGRQVRRRSEITAAQQEVLSAVGLRRVPEIW